MLTILDGYVCHYQGSLSTEALAVSVLQGPAYRGNNPARQGMLRSQMASTDRALQAVLRREQAAVADAARHMSQKQWEALRGSLPGLAHSVHVKELLLACYTAASD